MMRNLLGKDTLRGERELFFGRSGISKGSQVYGGSHLYRVGDGKTPSQFDIGIEIICAFPRRKPAGRSRLKEDRYLVAQQPILAVKPGRNKSQLDNR